MGGWKGACATTNYILSRLFIENYVLIYIYFLTVFISLDEECR